MLYTFRISHLLSLATRAILYLESILVPTKTATKINPFSISKAIQSRRYSLLFMGIALSLLGLIIATTPYFLFSASAYLIAATLTVAAIVKSGHFFVNKNKNELTLKNITSILLSIVIDLALAFFIIKNKEYSFVALALLLGVIFIADGVNQFIIAWRTPTARGRILFFLNALITAGLGIFVFIFSRSLTMEWIALILGLKIISLGIVLIVMVLRSKHDPVIYTKVDTAILHRIPGELYACYFGAAFHLGVYIGNNEMVHYRDDDLVHRTSWEEFLRGREPQHWVYPDLSHVPDKDVIRLAISQVGLKSKYNVLANNCEHFAIYWKSGGVTRFSKYAQISSAFENMNSRPIIGSLIELYGRAAEYIAFNFGGLLGKKASIKIRQFNSLVTAWMLRSVRVEPATKKS